MKKCFGILLLCLFAFNACEKDDFCTTNPVTPNLVIRFYDKNDITAVKSVSRLSIIAQSKTDSLITNATLDSIAIPLNGLASETVYLLKMNDATGNLADNKVDTLTITYTPKEDYISRSCGFRYVYEDVTLTVSQSWIDSLSSNTITEINHQIQSHVQIFH
ncbi:DUF6452 family protein [Tenacibaculum sp. MAR_2009_124]|uniref:DUF6452 family protein n=1 Tax=Tenacibaculum sp. MAR_2009_124 TaxID=1250059 RepID=UPI000B82A32B|nr:DUF6452 family protein [Tenacibaculum sp. MAR_2009_124]